MGIEIGFDAVLLMFFGEPKRRSHATSSFQRPLWFFWLKFSRPKKTADAQPRSSMTARETL